METILGISVIILFIGLFVNFLVTLALAKRLETVRTSMGAGFPDEKMLEAGTPAPAFTAEALDGSTVTLTDYAKKALALIFFSPDCSPCVEKIPMLNKLYPQALAQGVEMVLVNIGNAADIHAFATDRNIKLPLLSAPRSTNPFAEAYKALCVYNRLDTFSSKLLTNYKGGRIQL